MSTPSAEPQTEAALSVPSSTSASSSATVTSPGPAQSMRPFTILSIDGGGIRGLIAGMLLREIETRTGRPLASLFNLIAGTSTGGILALGVASGKPANKLFKLYRKHGADIFVPEHRPWKSKLKQHLCGFAAAMTVALGALYLFQVHPGIQPRTLSSLNAVDALGKLASGVTLIGAAAVGFQVGLKNVGATSLFGAFVRGGGAGGVIFGLLDIAAGFSGRTPMQSTLISGLAVSYAIGTGICHANLKQESLSIGTIFKNTLQELPATCCGLVGILGLGTNVPLRSAIQWSCVVLPFAALTSCVCSKMFPGLFPQYSRKGIDAILSAEFGEATMETSQTGVLITAYNLLARTTTFFDNVSHPDWRMADVAGATSAAPTYFPPKSIEMNQEPADFIDGGLITNNPALCAYAHAKHLGVRDEDIFLLSIGTGHFPRAPIRDVRSRGTLEWIKDVIEIQSEGAVHTHAILHRIFNSSPRSPGQSPRYYRIQVDLGESVRLDEVSDAAIQSLVGSVHGFLQDPTRHRDFAEVIRYLEALGDQIDLDNAQRQSN